MILARQTKRNIVLFVSAFVLLGVLHVALYYVDFTHCITTVFGSALVVLWAITAQERIVDARLRCLCLGVAASLLIHFVLQLARYDLTAQNTAVSRYLWYLMYVPMTAQPVLVFFLALNIRRPEDRLLPGASGLVIAAAMLLVLGVLSNDLHFLAWSFPSGVLIDDGNEKAGPFFYLITLFIYGLYAASLAVIFIKNHRYVMPKYRWLAAAPLLTGAVYFCLYPLGISKRFFPCHIWNMGDMTAFCLIATIEVCIQSGMIPANRGYETLFSAVRFPAVIADGVGNPVYRTGDTLYPFENGGDVRIVSHPIRGGVVVYPVNIEKIQQLNSELSERVEQLEARNAYLAEEARVLQESTELQTRNRLYERIESIVKPQLERIDAVLNSSAELTEGQLARIAVLKAYIKRRSNMELLAAGGSLPTGELATAVAESLEYVNICGAGTALSCAGEHVLPAALVTAAYENIEAVIEDSLDTLSNMVIAMRSGEKKLSVRIMLTADGFSFDSRDYERAGRGCSARAAVSGEDGDIIIVLTFSEEVNSDE